MRDIERDKRHLNIIQEAGLQWTAAQEACIYYIAQYEEAQARIAELERHIERIERAGYV